MARGGMGNMQQLMQQAQRMQQQMAQKQAELAEQLQVTDKAVSRWERGVGLPDITMLEPLSQALNVTVLELLRSEHLGSSPLSSQETEQTVLDAVQAAADQQRSLQNRWSTILVGAVCAALVPAAALLIGASESSRTGAFSSFYSRCAPCVRSNTRCLTEIKQFPGFCPL